MNSPDDWKQAKLEHTRHCAALHRDFDLANSLNNPPRYRHATHIATLRLIHLAKITLRAFWATKPPQRSGIALPTDPHKALLHPNLPILLTIYQHCIQTTTPLDYWFQAQFDILHRSPQMWINCFYGHKALDRYTDWDRRLSKRYTRSEDRRENTTPNTLHKIIQKAIIRGHQQALSWQPQLQLLDPPCLSAALAYISTYLPAWYLVSHACFRDDVLATGLCDAPTLITAWEHYKKSSWARKFCQESLDAAELQFGSLEMTL